MAVGQDILNQMEVLNQELQLQSGEEDVNRALIALNAAQDHFETLAAQLPDFKGDAIGTITTTGLTETTAFPAGVLRLDRLQLIDSNNNLPKWDLLPITRVGGHTYHRFWPWNVISPISPGEPRGYYTNGTSIFWDPLPADTQTVRWYGFQRAADITVSGTFAYDEAVILAFADFAVRLMRIGVDDAVGDIASLAGDVFGPLLASLGNFTRDQAPGMQYKYIHDA